MAQPISTALAVEGISKAFPGVQALSDVSFDCRAGEIHALVGENGAGKSTLMRILCGAYRADKGSLRVGGRVVAFPDPATALRHGVAMVYQDTRLVPDLDAAQNVFLGHEPGNEFVAYAKMRSETAHLLGELGVEIDSRIAARDLSHAQRQLVEIARALSVSAQVLILDEPTSALTSVDAERLFVILRRLRERGTAIVFISHRLPEVFAVADRITVLKDGRTVGTVDAAQSNPDQIVSMMVGRELLLAFPKRATECGDCVLEVQGLELEGEARDVSLAVHAGEILGLGGIAGGGQQATARALFGLGKTEVTFTLSGKQVTIRRPADALQAGLVYLPSDRKGEGMFLPHSITDNIALPHIRDWSTYGVVDLGVVDKAVATQIEDLSIRTPSARQEVGYLSGGNQQKVAFARWLLADPAVCIFDEPTQGVDVETKIEIYGIIRALAARGLGIIVISSDVLELIGLSDRIVTFANGSIVDEMAGADATEERVIGGAVGRLGKSPSERAAERAPEGRSTARRGSPLLARYAPLLTLTLVTLLLAGFATSQSQYFFTSRNLSSLGISVAPLLIVALGQLAVVLTGGIDLSIGPNISLTTAIASLVLIAEPPVPAPVGIGLCLAAGLAVGLLNGTLVRALKLPDLVATLATFSVVGGLALIVRPAPGGLLSTGFADTVVMKVGSWPVVFVLAVVAMAGFEVLLLRSRTGLRLYAVGSSPESASVAGISSGRVRMAAYVFAGLMGSLAGLVVAARIGSGDPQAGTNFTLLSVTAVVLGGASIVGGRGTALGTLVAAILVMLIQNILNQLHVSAYWQYVWTGILTLAAVAIYSDGLPRVFAHLMQLTHGGDMARGKRPGAA